MAELWEAIQTTFSQGATWLSILSGFLVTVRISAFSLLIGTLLAVPLCAAAMEPRSAAGPYARGPSAGRARLLKAPPPLGAGQGLYRLRRAVRATLSRLARAYIALVRGTPVTMLLMAFYYVVFARSRVEAEIVAIVAFSLHAAAMVAEVMRTALGAVQPGQLDAARALGMGRLEVFRSITLPQALRHGLPVYQNAAVNLIQWTSVVNYIAVTDLSRAINSAASRMLQPLLMLFVGIALYLLLAHTVYGLFALIGRIRFGPSHQYDRRRAA